MLKFYYMKGGTIVVVTCTENESLQNKLLGTDFGPNFQFTGELTKFPSHPNEEVGIVKIQITKRVNQSVMHCFFSQHSNPLTRHVI